MKIVITTVYDNLTQDFVDFWMKNCGPNYGFDYSNVEPGEDFTHVIKNKDPVDPSITGTTTIKLYSKGEPK